MILNTKQRNAAPTVAGGKFPIPPGDTGHAKAALARINQAKPPLTASQKATVRARAHKILGAAKRSVSANV